MSYTNNGKIANCIAILKKAILSNKINCNIPYTKYNFLFLYFLYRNGYISSMNLEKKERKINVIFKRYQDRYVLHHIKNYYKPGHLNLYNLKRIVQLKNKKNIQTIYVLWTSIGFLTVQEAFYRRIGGILVCKLN